jgi:hypothetical protein
MAAGADSGNAAGGVIEDRAWRLVDRWYAVQPGWYAVQPGDDAAAPTLPLSPAVLGDPSVVPGPVVVSVPAALWAAYLSAVGSAPATCHLGPQLLAAIGQVESGSLRGRSVDVHHRAVPPVLGPVLDGGPFASIPDTDQGRWDGDTTWDRAVGPMQFIPSTWARWGRDGDGDGVADPQDVEDAALSAAFYLCAGGRDLSQPADLRGAILSYNHSTSYLALVLSLMGHVIVGGPTVMSASTTGQVVPAALVPPATPTRAAPASPTTRPVVSPTTTASATRQVPRTTPLTASTAKAKPPATSSPTTTTTASPTAVGTPSPTSSACPSPEPSAASPSTSSTSSSTAAEATLTATTATDPGTSSSSTTSPSSGPTESATQAPGPPEATCASGASSSS